MAKIRRTPGARKDLKDALRFLEQLSQPAADRWMKKLDKRLNLLATFPRIGVRIERIGKLRDEDRVIVVGHLNVHYQVFNDEILVNRIAPSSHNTGLYYSRERHTSE